MSHATPESVQAVGTVTVSQTQSGKLLANIKDPSAGYFNMNEPNKDDRNCLDSTSGSKTIEQSLPSPTKVGQKQNAPTTSKRITKIPSQTLIPKNIIGLFDKTDASTSGNETNSVLNRWVLSQQPYVTYNTCKSMQSSGFTSDHGAPLHTTTSCPQTKTECNKSTNSSDEFTLALEEVPEQYLYKNNSSNKPCPHLEFSRQMQVSASTSETDSLKSNQQGTHHHAEVGQYLQDLYKRDQLTDMIIRVGQYTFTAHRAVLACYSSVLAERFMHRSSKLPVNEITLDDVSPSGFHDVLRYMYSGKLFIGIDNVMELLSVACRLEMKKLQNICQDVILELGPADLLTVLESARKQGITDSTETILQDVARGCSDILHSQQFLQLDVESICRFISRDDLNVTSELDVALAAVRWLQHHPDERHFLAVRVMTCVRLPLMTTDDLFTLTKSAQFLFEHEEIRHMIYYANWYQCNLARNESSFLDECPPSPRTGTVNIKPVLQGKKLTSPVVSEVRAPSPSILSYRFKSDTNVMRESPDVGKNGPTQQLDKCTKRETSDKCSDCETLECSASSRYCSPISDIILPCVLAIGGHDPSRKDSNNPGDSVVMYDIKRNRWTDLPRLPEPRMHHAVACLFDQVYITGGRSPADIDKEMACNTVFCLDTVSASWRVVSPMRHRRIHHSLVTVVGYMFAIAGQNPDHPLLSSIESYDVKTNRWSEIAPLSYGVIGAAASVYYDCVAVAGGYGGNKSDPPDQHRVLSNVQRYCPVLRRWTVMKPLITPRCYASLAFVKYKLLICGGLTYIPSQAKYEAVDTVEMYDDDSDTWSTITYLRLPRYNAGCCVYDSRFYIIGGMYEEGNQATQDVQSYNLIKDKWNNELEPLPQATCAVGCVTLT